MKLTKTAKQKWFKKHVNYFDLYYYDQLYNYSLARYNYFDGLYKEHDRFILYFSDLRKMARELDKLSDWEIFWNYKRLRFRNHQETHVFVFSWD